MSATKGIRWRMAAVAALMAALLTLAWAASAEAQESGWDCRGHVRNQTNEELQETHPAEAGGLQELCREHAEASENRSNNRMGQGVARTMAPAGSIVLLHEQRETLR